jgi:chitinase
MDSDVQDLALAQGIKDSLEEAGFDTVDSILKEAPLDISDKLGIEPYVAKIIKEVAKRANEESYEKETK